MARPHLISRDWSLSARIPIAATAAPFLVIGFGGTRIPLDYADALQVAAKIVGFLVLGVAVLDPAAWRYRTAAAISVVALAAAIVWDGADSGALSGFGATAIGAIAVLSVWAWGIDGAAGLGRDLDDLIDHHGGRK